MNTIVIKMGIIISVTLSTLCLSNVGFAQDAEGCQDYPLLSRMKHFVITECEYSFGVLEIAIAADASMLMEGYLTRIEYAVKESTGPPTSRQIIRHYKILLQELGGEILYEEDTVLTCQLVKNGKELAIVVETDESRYTVKILEIVGIIQSVIAGQMVESLIAAS